MKKNTCKFKIVGSFDTETYTMGSKAIPVCYQLSTWDSLDGDTNSRIYRKEDEFIEQLVKIIAAGKERGYTPVLAAYNLYFDFTTIYAWCKKNYKLRILGAGSTSVYTIDLVDGTDEDSPVVMRFWDCSHLEPAGLDEMGRQCGQQKIGGWDYDKPRTERTYLTEEEERYAINDTIVIKEYLKHICSQYPFVHEDDFGYTCLTKTGIVRLFERRVIGSTKSSTGRLNLWQSFMAMCQQEQARTYNEYALRKQAFRAGLAFTGTRWAGRVQNNTISVDVTSMYHASIAGRMMPIDFKQAPSVCIQAAVNNTMSTTIEDVLDNWNKPFSTAFHAIVTFYGLRPKSGSPFEYHGIQTLARNRFAQRISFDWDDGESSAQSYNAIHKAGFIDKCTKDVQWGMGKLISAGVCQVALTEIEAWIMAQVYEWDKMVVQYGEITTSWCEPPALILLSDMSLYGQKAELKKKITGSTAPSLDDELQYHSIKAMFNSVYGMLVQDEHKPQLDDEFHVEEGITPNNFTPIERPKTLYNYGSRIAAGSRLHLIVSILLLDKAYGNQIRITGGDTDSLKISTDVSADNIMETLSIMETVCGEAINTVCKRVSQLYPSYAHTLNGIGGWTLETPEPYELSIELFPKCRIHWDGEQFHATIAGVQQPSDKYSIADALTDLAKKYGPMVVMKNVFGMDLVIDYSLAHAFIPVKPQYRDEKLVGKIQNGDRYNCHRAIALIPSEHTIGDTTTVNMRTNLQYIPAQPRARRIMVSDNHVLVYDMITGEPLFDA